MTKTFIPSLAAAAALALGGLAGTAAHAQVAPTPAPTKVYDSGNNVIGLNGLTVQGQQFNVQFVGGSQTCVQTFSGCDSTGDFAFQSEQAAKAASQALLAATAYADYTSAYLVNGITLYTPYGLYAGFLNRTGVSLSRAHLDVNGGESTQADSKLASDSLINTSVGFERYAVWTPSVSAVPEPGSWALMAAGLGAVGFMARRRRSA